MMRNLNIKLNVGNWGIKRREEARGANKIKSNKRKIIKDKTKGKCLTENSKHPDTVHSVSDPEEELDITEVDADHSPRMMPPRNPTLPLSLVSRLV